MEIFNESWSEMRQPLFEMLVKRKFGVDHSKLLCKNCGEKAVIRCEECGLKKYLCGKCDVEIHQHFLFHDREAINNGYFEPISSCVIMDSKDNNWTSVVGKKPLYLLLVQSKNIVQTHTAYACTHTAICVQAQTANIFARLFTFETGRLPLETEMFHRSCDVSH
jgi:hypothetical protein